ncbi:MAG: hypothetical protein ACSHXK_08705 [Oceanococcus sp.]
MKTNYRKRLTKIVLLLSLALPAQAQLSVNASPAVRVVNLGQDNSFNVSWVVGTTRSGAPLRSNQAVLIDANSGSILQIYPRSLNSNDAGTISESVLIRQATLNRALQDNSSQLLYQRQWRADSGEQGQASVRISIVGSLAGELNIRDVELRFNSGESQLKSIGQNAPLQAQARISHQGKGGIIDYEWRILLPSAARGESRSIPIGQGRESLTLGSPYIIESPLLPSRQLGNYQLQFVLKQPRLHQAELRYRVISQQVPQVALLRPLAGARVASNALYKWSPLRGAQAYQFEMWRDNERLGGILIPADQTPQTPLSDLLREQLVAGCLCQWRVLAYADDGQVMAISPTRKLRLLATDSNQVN